jgi:hypothetical protein
MSYRDNLIKKFCAGIPLSSLVQALQLGITALTLIEEMSRKIEEKQPDEQRREPDMATGHTPGTGEPEATGAEPNSDR